MSTQIQNNSDSEISRLRSAAHTGNLKNVVSELVTICKTATIEQCSKLSSLMPRLSVETALHSVRIR